jgi:hypothetical protein
MTATVTAQVPAAVRWRQWRTPALIVAFVILAAVAIALLQPRPGTAGYLSPSDTGPTGTRAVTDILSARGHSSAGVSPPAAAVAAPTAGSTLVITSPYLLSAADLRALGRTRAALVLVEPDAQALRVLAPRLRLAGGAQVGPVLPACALRAATLAGAADLGGPGLEVQPGPGTAAQCYIIPDGRPTLVQLTTAGRTVTVLGTGLPLTNSYLARQGNAALALNLLGAGGPVVWLIPSVPPPTAVAGGARSLTSLVPEAAWLVAAQLGLAALLAAAWRARRLGPLTPEPLPVVVRASETVEGHARLYQSRRARDRVAANLRATVLARLLPAIGLPAGAEPAAATAALAARSTLDEAAVAELLYGPVPGTDAALITLASDLDALATDVLDKALLATDVLDREVRTQ